MLGYFQKLILIDIFLNLGLIGLVYVIDLGFLEFLQEAESTPSFLCQSFAVNPVLMGVAEIVSQNELLLVGLESQSEAVEVRVAFDIAVLADIIAVFGLLDCGV